MSNTTKIIKSNNFLLKTNFGFLVNIIILKFENVGIRYHKSLIFVIYLN